MRTLTSTIPPPSSVENAMHLRKDLDKKLNALFLWNVSEISDIHSWLCEKIDCIIGKEIPELSETFIPHTTDLRLENLVIVSEGDHPIEHEKRSFVGHERVILRQRLMLIIARREMEYRENGYRKTKKETTFSATY